MPYRIKVRNQIVEIDTAREVMNLLNVTADYEASGVSTPTSPVAADTSSLLRWFRGLPENQRHVLHALSTAEEGLYDSDLQTLLRFTTNSELGGTMAGISKQAKKIGLPPEAVYWKAMDGDRPLYHIGTAMREVLTSDEFNKPIPLVPTGTG